MECALVSEFSETCPSFIFAIYYFNCFETGLINVVGAIVVSFLNAFLAVVIVLYDE